MRDLYEILGVRPDATPEEIKRAYRRKARELHPDAGGDEEAFKEVQHAYHILSDPERRRRYDRYGDDGRGRVGPATDPFFGAESIFGGFEDIIDAFFGTPRRTRRRRSDRGRDVLVTVTITLEEVATGTRAPVEVEVAGICEECGGTGSRDRTAPGACRVCHGTGSVQRIVRTAFGQIASATTCASCAGTGTAPADPCPACGGEGRRRRRRTLKVEIPPGVEDGDRLRVAGAGEAGRLGGPAGDLLVEVVVAPHPVFRREGRDLWCDATVSMVHAALGGSITLDGIDGSTLEVDLPAGTQHGDVLTVRGAGLPTRGGGPRGDLHIRVDVEIPRSLSGPERELLQRFAELRGEEVTPRGLLRRLRDALS